MTSTPPAIAPSTSPRSMKEAARMMLVLPPAQAALALNEGPRVRSTLTRLADTVEAMSLGITVAETRRMLLRAPKLLRDLDMGIHVTRSASHDHGERGGVDPRLLEREPSRPKRQKRRPAHEPRLLLVGAERLGREGPGIEADELTAAAVAHRFIVGVERRVLARAQIAHDALEIVAHVAAHARTGNDDLTSLSRHKPVSLS